MLDIHYFDSIIITLANGPGFLRVIVLILGKILQCKRKNFVVHCFHITISLYAAHASKASNRHEFFRLLNNYTVKPLLRITLSVGKTMCIAL